jgi:hypothetical protein
MSSPDPPQRTHLPNERLSLTRTLRVKAGRHTRKYDVVAGYYDDGRLGEIFISTAGRDKPWCDALAMAISVALQHGAPWDALSQRLKYHGFAPAGMATDGEGWQAKVSSPTDMIAKWLDEHQVFRPTKE